MSYGKQRKEQAIEQALNMEAEEADKANALGFMSRALAQATIPHSKADGPEFTRRNGDLSLSILSPSDVGLPYGSKPRLLVAWVVSEAVRRQSRTLYLGASLSEFMAQLDLVPTGGQWGTVTSLKQQMKRLFSSSITATYDSGDQFDLQNVQMVSRARLWWDPKRPDQTTLWQSTLTLGEDFFQEITQRPVPIDMRAYRILRDSPMCLDIYTWLTYRMSYLRKRTVVPWEALEAQFGSNYQDPKNFRAAFRKHLKRVLAVYHEAQVAEVERGIELRPSPPHVRQLVEPPGDS